MISIIYKQHSAWKLTSTKKFNISTYYYCYYYHCYGWSLWICKKINSHLVQKSLVVFYSYGLNNNFVNSHFCEQNFIAKLFVYLGWNLPKFIKKIIKGRFKVKVSWDFQAHVNSSACVTQSERENQPDFPLNGKASLQNVHCVHFLFVCELNSYSSPQNKNVLLKIDFFLVRCYLFFKFTFLEEATWLQR